ncbi:MAG: DUF362 domain-containing protein [Thermodesulfobacteriota bacterium]|nr:DUF362 domain-containing protein [Thermodesulfobacteriota bacterium]
MNRREFLRFQTMGLLWMIPGVSGLLFSKKAFSELVPDVAVVKGSAAAATRAAVELLGGMKEFVKPGNRVIIKPNMSFPTPPERASNTHPDVVRELATMCKEAQASKTLVLDNTLSAKELCLETSGIRQACEAIDSKMVFALSDDSLYRTTEIPRYRSMRETEIMKEVLKSDVLIAAPVAKSHSSTGVSLSMKGMMGLIYNRGIMHRRYDLNTSIVDLCTILKADLAVIDGTRVLSTNGPRGPGKVLRENTVIASKDMVAADAYAVSIFEWYGKKFKPSQVSHIREAHERGLGRMDIDNLKVQSIVL